MFICSKTTRSPLRAYSEETTHDESSWFVPAIGGRGQFCFCQLAPVAAPEIDGGSAVSALFLLSGGLLALRSRRKK